MTGAPAAQQLELGEQLDKDKIARANPTAGREGEASIEASGGFQRVSESESQVLAATTAMPTRDSARA